MLKNQPPFSMYVGKSISLHSACWEANPPFPVHAGKVTPHPTWTEQMRHACENITLPQTSFAGGNKLLCIMCIIIERNKENSIYCIDH